jgi:hypothetical protein
VAAAAVIGSLLFPARCVVGDRLDRVNSAHNVHMIGLAICDYHDTHGQLPSDVRAKDGRPLLSWRVLLLPYLEQKELFEQFRLDEPWDSAHNKKQLPRMPFHYCLPRQDAGTATHYQILVGPGTAFERPGLTWEDFPDGRDTTLLVVEAAEPVPWTRPADLAYNPAGPLPALGGLFRRPIEILGFPVSERAGFNAVLADGSARFLRSDLDASTVRALITRNGGEKVNRSDLD